MKISRNNINNHIDGTIKFLSIQYCSIISDNKDIISDMLKSIILEYLRYNSHINLDYNTCSYINGSYECRSDIGCIFYNKITRECIDYDKYVLDRIGVYINGDE